MILRVIFSIEVFNSFISFIYYQFITVFKICMNDLFFTYPAVDLHIIYS